MALPSMTLPAGGRLQRAVALLCAVLVLAAAINAFWFTYRTANPLIVSDNWFYLDRIVYRYAHGQLEPGDLLVKRSGFDHSQPLRRALLLLNYEWFDLDFRIEAVFGAAVGALNLLLLGWLVRRELREGMPVSSVAFAALAAVYLSLSATVVFTWSLLTLAFTNHLVLFLWMAVVWKALGSNTPKTLVGAAAMTFLMSLVGDDIALVSILAATLALLLQAVRERAWSRPAMVFLALAGGWMAYQVYYRIAAPPIPPSHAAAVGSGHLLRRLWAIVPDAWTWVTVPLGSALVHRTTLQPWAHGASATIVAGVAILFGIAHLWFWRQAFAQRINRPAFMAVVLMLMFYGLVAALLIGRVSDRGSGYLWQPRYAMTYRWHIVALLLMLVAQSPRLVPLRRPARAVLVMAPLVLILVAEAGLSAVAWTDSIYSRRWSQRLAQQVFALAEGERPKACVPQLTVCGFAPDRRQRLMHFLEENRLSVFSDQVRRRNGIGAEDAP